MKQNHYTVTLTQINIITSTIIDHNTIINHNAVLDATVQYVFHMTPPPPPQEFLNDYGMVWVGNSDSSERHLRHSPPGHTKSMATSDGVWVPGRSLAGDGGEFVVDYDAIVRNVKELNLLAGEGNSHVTTTADKCAKLKVQTVFYTQLLSKEWYIAWQNLILY